MVQLSPMNGGTSYSVGYNNDSYSLPVKSTACENEGQDSCAYTGPAELQSSEQESKLSSSSKEYETEGLYAETDLYFQNASPVKTVYEVPGSVVKTSPSTPRRRAPPINIASKPPNFKRPPPPPPPGNKPAFETNKQKHTPALPKTAPQKDIPVTTSALQLPHESRVQKFRKSDSSSSNESLNTKREQEPIFASRSDIGFSETDNNNNRHLLATSPPRNVEKTHASPPLGLYFVNVTYHDPSKILGNNIGLDMPPIVPPPPSTSPILDSEVMVVPPPPPMRDNDTSCTPLRVQPPPPIYPPPRLIRPSERAELDVNSRKSCPDPPDYSQDDDGDDDELQWLDMVEGLPPPPPDLLEDTRY